ncbi:unnamed protein product [Paramecium primaurelia]|uniref:Protein kinase domain-containing protein n=1 Tax=Paramecium primaurelia TaxID=5886 RepID=A0A8S1LRZ0_PARPR|nr:unnamed protein product [Paramecium primaurelia]
MGTCSSKKGTLKCINLRNLQNNLVSEGPASPTLIFSKRNDHTLDFNYVDEVIQPSNLINENYLKYYNQIRHVDKVIQNQNSIIVQHILTRQIFIAEVLDNNDKTNKYISLISNLFHENLQDFVEIYYYCSQYTIIKNYCNGGSLESFILNESKHITIYQKQIILGQIFNVISYLHSKSIVHGNLTLKSFEIVDQSQTIQIKLVDFFSVVISDKKPAIKLKFSSPQLVQAYLDNQIIEPTFKDDVWSLGIIGVRIVYNFSLFTGNSFKDFLENVLQGKRNQIPQINDTYYYEIQDLLNQMLQVNPQKRIDMIEILESSFMNSFQFNLQPRNINPIMQSLQQILFYMMAEMYSDNSLEYLSQLKNTKRITRFQLATLVRKQYKHIYDQSESLFAVNQIFKSQSELQYIELISRFTDKRSIITKSNLQKAFLHFSNQQHYITLNDILPFFQEKELQLKQAFKLFSQEKIDILQFFTLMFDYLQQQ